MVKVRINSSSLPVVSVVLVPVAGIIKAFGDDTVCVTVYVDEEAIVVPVVSVVVLKRLNVKETSQSDEVDE